MLGKTNIYKSHFYPCRIFIKSSMFGLTKKSLSNIDMIVNDWNTSLYIFFFGSILYLLWTTQLQYLIRDKKLYFYNLRFTKLIVDISTVIKMNLFFSDLKSNGKIQIFWTTKISFAVLIKHYSDCPVKNS